MDGGEDGVKAGAKATRSSGIPEKCVDLPGGGPTLLKSGSRDSKFLMVF